jgi:uncharacterized protein (DUF983 family)
MNWLAGLLTERCPKCRKGKVFKSGMYNLAHFAETNSTCSYCNHRFEEEPGFFWASMYFSYAIGVAIVLATGFVVYLCCDPNAWIYSIVSITCIFLLLPLNFRYSRMLLLYTFSKVNYDKNL